jgi:NAD+ kinase
VKLTLVLHPTRSVAADLAASVAATAQGLGFDVTVDEIDSERVPGVPTRPSHTLDADVVVAVGGDGTVLEAARQALPLELPVLGVNAGNVGFLAEIQPGGLEAGLATLKAGDFTVTERMTLRATTSRGVDVSALNDVVVEKDVSQNIIRVEVSVDDEHLVEYRADGVIVASPTGSTAYNFSAGGPLMDPDIRALVVTAVAPHTLFGRPIVFGENTRLRLRVAGERAAKLIGDGRDYGLLEPGDSVEIGAGSAVVRLVRLVPQHFAAAIKRKFHLHDA